MAQAPTLQTRATVRYLRVSPYKIRQILPLVRGKSVEEAERVLELCQREAAGDVLKVLESAIANAEHNNSLPADELYVARAYCDEGPTRKSGQARARGRFFRVRKRSSHLTIVVARYTEDELEAKRRREEQAGGARGRTARGRAERVRASRAAARAEAAPAEHEHEHDHDHEPTESTAAEAVEAPEEGVEGGAEAGETGDNKSDAEETE